MTANQRKDLSIEYKIQETDHRIRNKHTEISS